MKREEDALGHDALTGPNETYPWDWESTGAGGLVVYDKARGWQEYGEIDLDTDEDNERGGWPFRGDKSGEMRVLRVMWDDPTSTVVVIVDGPSR